VWTVAAGSAGECRPERKGEVEPPLLVFGYGPRNGGTERRFVRDEFRIYEAHVLERVGWVGTEKSITGNEIHDKSTVEAEYVIDGGFVFRYDEVNVINAVGKTEDLVYAGVFVYTRGGPDIGDLISICFVQAR
jgi:hypothetical protein